ncbi:MAG: hypothetical protein NUV77_08180, partial [Thermoguttaceae bacterium]|nr:hypothetical protein [Thermoguttaceae bacterium]
SVEGVVLPQYGFLARVPTDKGPVEAMIARRGETIVELARSPDQLYVNGREVVAETLPIRVAVERVRHTGGRGLEIALRWQADVPIPAGWVPFVHFCDEEGEIVFQAGHRPARFDTEQKGAFSGVAVTSIPEGLAPGQVYELRVGIYHPKTGVRLPLSGPDDGGRRIRLGKIRLEGQGKDLTGVAWTPHQPEPDPVLARQNPEGKPIDFGATVAAGGFRLTVEGQRLVVTPLPEASKPSEIRIRQAQLPWRLPELAQVETLAEDGRVLGRQALRRDRDVVIVTASPEAFAYRLGP